MNLDKIGVELEQLSALAEGWKVVGRIDELERDLALEKLRRIYETVRFADEPQDAAPESVQPVEMPVSLDLDQMLEIVPLVEEELEDVMSAPQPTTAKPAEASLPTEEPVVASVELLPEPEVVATVSDAEEPSELPKSIPEQPEAASAEPEKSDAVSHEPVSDVEVTAEPAAAPVVAPEVPQPAAARPTVVEPALFGMDEIVQHKRKQRVIMSLYEQPAATRPAAEPAREQIEKPEFSHQPEPVKDEPKAFEELVRISESFPDPVPQPEPETEVTMPTETAPVVVESVAEPVKESVAEIPASGAVLGEVINRGVHTLGETIAPARDAVSEMAHKTPVTDLREAIGINDKFLLIRDLFDGDAEACDRTIDTLNGFTDLDDCMIHIAEHYAWNPNSDGAKLLVELLERKLA